MSRLPPDRRRANGYDDGRADGPSTQPLRLPQSRREAPGFSRQDSDDSVGLGYLKGTGQASGSSLTADRLASLNPSTRPSRPARSERRPPSTASDSPFSSPRQSGGAFENGDYDRPASRSEQAPPVSLQSKLQRAIEANKRAQEGYRPDSRASLSSVDEEEDVRRVAPVASTSRNVMNGHADPTTPVAPKAMQSVMSAFAEAGQRQQRARAGSIAPPPRRRRGAESAQGESVKFKGKKIEYPATPAFREIERVLSRIEAEWPEMIPEEYEAEDGTTKKADFDAVTLALSLLDPNTPTDRIKSFMRLKEDLGRALKSHIQQHYRAFDTSVSAYNNILANLGSAQKETNDLRGTLSSVRDILLTRRTELTGMMSRRTELNEMENVMDTLDQLKNVPDKMESLLSEKRFLSAVVLLVRSLKTINKPEMGDAAGVADLRTYLQGQEAAIVDILLDELHAHLYLKSFYCESRWRSYSRGQTSISAVDWGPDTVEQISVPEGADLSARPARTHSKPSKLARFLTDLGNKPSVDPVVAEPQDADADEAAFDAVPNSPTATRSPTLPEGSDLVTKVKPNPEADSFTYIESLLEALACLGKLGHAIESMLQRMPVETYNLVEGTVEEVEERNEPLRRASSLPIRPSSTVIYSSGGSANRASMMRLTMAQQNAAEIGAETLRDLFWTLFSKLDAVLQGFRIANEVTQRISERRKLQDDVPKSSILVFSLLEVWKPIQSEVRALLNDYLTDGDDRASKHSSRNPIISVNEVLRTGRIARDANKALFRFADSDQKSHPNKQLKLYEDELFAAIKASVPGLVQSNAEQHLSAAVFGTNTGSAEDRLNTAAGRTGGTHRLLVSPDAFNVSILFAPTLAFLERVRDVMPGGLVDDDKGFGSFLDDFILSIFLPQLEDKVQSVYLQAVGASDAFQEDTAARSAAGTPVVKVATNLMQLITNLCSMLRSTPFHRERYSHLIITVVEHFLQKCGERFMDLTRHDAEHTTEKESQAKLAAIWAQRPALAATLAQLKNPAAAEAALREEIRLEQELRAGAPVAQIDLILLPKRLTALGVLFSSLTWFISHIRKLRGAKGNTEAVAADGETAFSLPLTAESSSRLDALLKAYDQLADTALFTLRIEARLRALHYLERAMVEGTYELSADVAEPDPYIVDLNSSLSQCDECAASSLASTQRSFVLYGLPELVDSLLISLAPRVKEPTPPGVHKMMRNILALQQNLRNLGDKPLPCDFRSRKYWDLIREANPEALVDSLQEIQGEPPFTFEEYEAALAIICGIDPASETKDGEPLTAGTDKRRRLYNEALIGLHTVFA